MSHSAPAPGGPSVPERPGRPAGGLSRTELLGLAALTAVALALRLTSLSRSLFTDEAYSLALSQRGLGHMISLFGYEANGTLYSLLLWPTIRIFGDSAAVIRVPAVLAGAASVPALWWAARGFGGRRAAWAAATLLALNPMAVWYSKEARAYAFVMLAACLSFGALARALRGDLREDGKSSRGPWALYVLSMAAMAYSDLLAAPLALPAQAVIARRAGREAWRAWLRSLAALAVCCVPLVVFAVIARGRRNALYWLPKTDRSLVELGLQEFSGGFAGVKAIGWLTLLVGGLLVGFALLRSRGPAAKDARTALAATALWGLAPTIILLVVSFAEPLYFPRYAILSLPGLCLLAGLALERAWVARSLLAPGAALCVAALTALAVYGDYEQRHEIQEEWHPVAAWLQADRSPGQPVILDNALVLPTLGYYYAPFRAGNDDLIVQEWRDMPLPAGFVGFKDRTGYGSVPDGPPSAAEFASLARRGGGDVWLVVSEVDYDLQSSPKEGAAVAWARAHCQIETRESTGVWVLRARGCST